MAIFFRFGQKTDKKVPEKIYDAVPHVLMMRGFAMTVLFLVLFCTVSPALAAGENRYSYITIDSVAINLTNTTADIQVDYSLDGGATFILFFLGKNDLRQKLERILNYDEAQVTTIDMTTALFSVKNVSYVYGDGIYWFPSHEFGATIPRLDINTPRVTRQYNNTREFPNGIGYFAD